MSVLQKAMEVTDGIGTWHCSQFRERIFARNLPIALALAYRYKRTAKSNSYVHANRELLKTDEFLTLGEKGNRISVYTEDEELRSFCELKVNILKGRFYKAIGQFDRISPTVHRAIRLCVAEFKRYGLEFHCENWSTATVQELSEAIARLFDPDWWRRRIRQRQDELIETMNIRLGLVNRNKGIYASNLLVKRKREQRRRNEFTMKHVELENDLGQVFNLFDINQTSVSNPVNRRNELMTRISGFEEFAKELGHVGVFITMTAPSKYHAYLSKPCVPNPRYKDYSPKDTQSYLNGVWARTRAGLKRRKIEPYGFRVVEPHHDGTPHWHMLFFIDKQYKQEMLTVLQSYALAEDGDEKGAQEHRLTVTEIDPAKGSAAGYIAKYISKNIDGYRVDADLYGQDAVQSAERITAWASAWRIRQFQQIGGASVTVWRELRRLNGSIPEIVREAIGQDLERFDALVIAADRGDWKGFTELMGGVNVKRKEQFLRACYLVKEECGKYKETVSKLLGVLISGLRTVVTRPYTWVVRRLTFVCKVSNSSAPHEASLSGFWSKPPPLEFCQ